MYFEFDDVRRIHQPYTDNLIRAPMWKPPTYNSPWLNWQRGMYAMSTSILIFTPLQHIHQSAYVLNQFYERPKTRTEFNIFAKEIFRVPNFWKDMFKKTSYGLVAAGGDTAVKLAAWQYVHGGTWSPQDFADSNSFKPLICATMAFAPTCWLTIPFENARRAYYADKQWPIEMRRNYTSPTQALLRIPFEEGLGYLFKGGFPLAANQFLFWTIYCYVYIWMKNKLFFWWVYDDISYDLCKASFIGTAFGLASIVSYPFYQTREMVDLWPKERGGFCTWNNSYRQCAKWMVENMELQYFNFFRNYPHWFRRYGIHALVGMWMADNLGMMSNCNEAWNSLETNFPNYSEST